MQNQFRFPAFRMLFLSLPTRYSTPLIIKPSEPLEFFDVLLARLKAVGKKEKSLNHGGEMWVR